MPPPGGKAFVPYLTCSINPNLAFADLKTATENFRGSFI